MSVVLPITADPRFRISTAVGGETTFSVPFPFQANADVIVQKIGVDGTMSILANPANYSLSGAGNPSGGTVTLVTPAVAGEKYIRLGQAVLSRTSSIVRNGRYASQPTDDDLDRALIVAQENRRDVDRAWKAALGTAGGAIIAGPAGAMAMFDASGNIVAGTTDPSASANAAAASAAASAASASAASTSAAGSASSASAASGSATAAATSASNAAASAASFASIISGNQSTFTADHTVVAADLAKALIANSASAINFPLTAAATLGAKFGFVAKNIGAGTLTIDPNGAETIDGQSTLVLLPGQSAAIFTDGSTWRSLFVPASIVDGTLFRIRDTSNATKKLGFDPSGLTTERVYKAPDAAGTLLISTMTPRAGQLSFSSSTVIKLLPFNGNAVAFPDGTLALIPSAGVSATISSLYLNGVAAQTLTAGTVYYVYAFMNSGTLTLDFSATGHATDSTTGIEIKSGDSTRILVGMVQPKTGPVFADSATDRLVASWFNRRPRQLFNSFTTTRSTTSTTFVEVNSEIRCNFLSWGDGATANYAGGGKSSATNQSIVGGPSLDGSTSAGSFAAAQYDTGATSGLNGPMSTSVAVTPSEGSHYFTYMALVGGATGSWVAGNSQGVLSGIVTQ